jgi:hypothetical protein
LERAWSLERLQLDPRRTQVSISLCVASSLCCKKRRRRRRRWHRLLLLLCAVELATRSLLQRKLRSFGASPELAFLSCSKLRAPEPAARPASSELRKAPELALQGLVLAQVFFSSLDLGLNWFLNCGKSVYSQVLGVFGNSGHVVLQRGISDNYSDPIPCFCRSHLSSNLFFLYIFGMGLQSQLLYPKYLLCFV